MEVKRASRINGSDLMEQRYHGTLGESPGTGPSECECMGLTLQEQARLSGQGSATDVVSPGRRVDGHLGLEEVSLNLRRSLGTREGLFELEKASWN